MSNRLVSSVFLASLKAQYEEFSKYAETSLVDEWLEKKNYEYKSYGKEAIERATWGRELNLPRGMITPYCLKTPCYCFGRTPDDRGYNKHSRTDHISAYYDLIHLFWTGYFQFLKALDKGDEKIIITFANEATSLIRIPKSAKNDSMINEKNKKDVMIAFVGIYALHLLMTDERTISTKCRIEAVRLWKKVDPETKFADFRLWYYDDLGYNEGKPNLLPSSFDPGHLPDKVYGQHEFYENKKIQELFGNPYIDCDRFPLGLKLLLANHKNELIQIVESFLRLHISEKFVVRFLYQIIELDDETLSLIFGEKASYRNKGVISEIDDELNHLGVETLRQMVVSLRQKTKDDQEKTNDLEMKLQKTNQSYASTLYQFTRLKIMLSEKSDYKGYFKILGFNTITPHSEIKSLLEIHYRYFSLQYHPDKSGDPELQKLLNEAVEVFRDSEKWAQYVAECDEISTQITNKMFH